MTSTPGSVGPGRYVPEVSALPSNHLNFPRWTLPKAGRPADERKNQIEIKHMIQDQHSGVKLIQKIVLVRNVTLAQVEEAILKN